METYSLAENYSLTSNKLVVPATGLLPSDKVSSV